MESLYSQVVIIPISQSPVSVSCWVEVNLATVDIDCIIFYLSIRIFCSPNVCFCTQINLKENAEPLFRVNGALPGMKRTTPSSVVHPLHRVFTLWGPHCTEQHKVTPTLCFLFFEDSFLHRSTPRTQLSPPYVFWVGCLLKQESGVGSSISGPAPPIDSLGERRIKFTLHHAPINSELSQSLINSPPFSLPKFKEHRHLPFEARPINIWTADRSHPVPAKVPSSPPADLLERLNWCSRLQSTAHIFK